MSARLRRVRLRSQGCRDRGVHSLTHPSRVACLALIPMWHTESQPPPLPPPAATAPPPPPSPPPAAAPAVSFYLPTVGGNKEQRTADGLLTGKPEWEMAGLPCREEKHAAAGSDAGVGAIEGRRPGWEDGVCRDGAHRVCQHFSRCPLYCRFIPSAVMSRCPFPCMSSWCPHES